MPLVKRLPTGFGFLALLGAALLTTGCGSSSSDSSPAPAAAARLTGDSIAGQELFQTNCMTSDCHPADAFANGPSPDIADADALLAQVRTALGDAAAEMDVVDIATHLDAAVYGFENAPAAVIDAATAGDAALGMQKFQSNCATSCHPADAFTNGLSADISSVAALREQINDDKDIARYLNRTIYRLSE